MVDKAFMSNVNFQPAVRCPHCNGSNHPPISGFGGELSTRFHTCKHCGKQYTVVIYTTTSTDLDGVTMDVTIARDRITYLRNRIKEVKEGIENRTAELAKELIRREASSRGNQN